MSELFPNHFDGSRGVNPLSTYRAGIVVDRDPKAGTIRVCHPDREGMVSYWLPILQRSTAGTKDHWLPRLGDQVHVLYSPEGTESGIVLGTSFTNANYSAYDATVASTSTTPGVCPTGSTTAPNPSPTSPNARHTVYSDGTTDEYNTDNSTRTFNCVGTINVAAGATINVNGKGAITIVGGSTISVTAASTVTITAPSINLNSVLIDSSGNVTVPAGMALHVDNIYPTTAPYTTAHPRVENADGSGGSS